MGDIVEITTSHNEINVFYKLLSNAVTFEVKASANVAVGLTNRPGYECDLWIIIGQGNSSYLWRSNLCNKEVETKNILSDKEYRRFWITWFNNCIKFGKHGDYKPLLSIPYDKVNLKYITFGLVEGEIRPAHWKLELPPLHFNNNPPVKIVKGGKPTWVSADTQLPDDAIIGGYERDTLYIIRASHNSSLTPGKFVPSQGLGYIPWGGIGHEKSDIEVLCGYDYVWMKTTQDDIPVGAVVGGYSEVRHETLYVGRVMHEGHLIPGKIQPSHRVCYIAFEGREIASEEYEILVSPIEFYRSDNKLFLTHLYVPRNRHGADYYDE